MKMLDVFKQVVSESSVSSLQILGVQESEGTNLLRVSYTGMVTTVELNNRCEPGYEQDYCWYVLATAMSNIYVNISDFKNARRWLDALHDRLVVEEAKIVALTESETELCKIVGASWASYDGVGDFGIIHLWSKKPLFKNGSYTSSEKDSLKASIQNVSLFPSLRRGELVKVEGL